MKIESAVAEGAVLLDNTFPGWWNRINVEGLDLWSEQCCVLAQLCGNYEAGLLIVTPRFGRQEDGSKKDPRHYGFTCGVPRDHPAWDEAARCWIAVIALRKAMAGSEFEHAITESALPTTEYALVAS